MKLGMLDAMVLCAYFAGIVVFGIAMAVRSKTKSSSDFFLASKTLPWYAVGAWFIASNISTEHFIGIAGWGSWRGRSNRSRVGFTSRRTASGLRGQDCCLAAFAWLRFAP